MLYLLDLPAGAAGVTEKDIDMEQKKKKLYPMKFRPAAEKAGWGGDRFIAMMGKSYSERVEADGQQDEAGKSSGRKKYVEVPLTRGDRIGESWELADLGFRDSEVSGGWLDDSTISEVLETYLEDVVGENVYSYFGRQFPLMVKFLDVEGRMPLMVCPDDEIAAQRYDTLGKMKLWYVLDAEPGSKLYMGFSRAVSASELYDRCHQGTLEEVLNVVVPHKGDAFLVPPGLVHSAAGGVLMAEIAESSDLDFRIYNWGDAVETGEADFTSDPAGTGRASSKKPARKNLMNGASLSDTEELSLEAAFDFLKMDKYDSGLTIPAGGHSDKAFDANVKSASAPDAAAGKVTDKLAALKEFTVTKLALKDALHIDTGTTDAFLIYVCVEGSASVQVQGEGGAEKYDVAAGEVILVPADVTDFFIVPQDRNTSLLEVTIEPYEAPDGYIDPDAEEKLPEDSADEGKKPSVEDFLRANMKQGGKLPWN